MPTINQFPTVFSKALDAFPVIQPTESKDWTKPKALTQPGRSYPPASPFLIHHHSPDGSGIVLHCQYHSSVPAILMPVKWRKFQLCARPMRPMVCQCWALTSYDRIKRAWSWRVFPRWRLMMKNTGTAPSHQHMLWSATSNAQLWSTDTEMTCS